VPQVQGDIDLAFGLTAIVIARTRADLVLRPGAVALADRRSDQLQSHNTGGLLLQKTHRRRKPEVGQAARHARSQAATNARANWQRLHTQYLERAQAAAGAGNRIDAENYHQHADHYFRMLADAA